MKKTEPFNPLNTKHVEGLIRTIKLLKNKAPASAPEGILIPRKVFKKLLNATGVSVDYLSGKEIWSGLPKRTWKENLKEKHKEE